MKKKLGILICAVLLVVASVGATLAWLSDKTQEVTNTFTVGDINILLNENGATDTNNDGKVDSNSSFEIIPGTNLDKEPKVTVKENSEACWLFVTVTEENWPQDKETDGTLKVKYEVITDSNGWTLLSTSGEDGNKTYVYYREVAATAEDAVIFDILKAGANEKEIIVSSTLTKTELNAMTTPKLTFKAYAVQKENINTVQQAWTEANK